MPDPRPMVETQGTALTLSEILDEVKTVMATRGTPDRLSEIVVEAYGLGYAHGKRAGSGPGSIKPAMIIAEVGS